MSPLLVEAQRLLQGYRPGPSSPAEAMRQQTQHLLAHTDAPFSRTQSRPGHITTSAFVLHPTRPEILLIHHAKLRLWLQPGGHVEPTDESLVASARREVAEETGLTSTRLAVPGLFDVDVHTIPARTASGARPGEPEHLHFDLRFLLQSDAAELRAGSDALDARWVPWCDIGSADTDGSVQRVVARIQAQLL